MRVTINDPSKPADTELEIPYLGLFKNGHSVELTDEQVAFYEANTGIELTADIYIGDPDVELDPSVDVEDTDALDEPDDAEREDQ